MNLNDNVMNNQENNQDDYILPTNPQRQIRDFWLFTILLSLVVCSIVACLFSFILIGSVSPAVFYFILAGVYGTCMYNRRHWIAYPWDYRADFYYASVFNGILTMVEVFATIVLFSALLGLFIVSFFICVLILAVKLRRPPRRCVIWFL